MANFKILHTSDWHLGKKLFKTERYEEHEKFLAWLIGEIKFREIDILIVAGDIFDVPSAPNQAQKLFYDFIYQLRDIPNLQTVVIGGNHDSNSLLKIPQNFFKDNNCFIHAGLEDNIESHNLYFEKDGIRLGIKTLPYFRNYELLNQLNLVFHDNESDTHLLENYFQKYFTKWNTEKPLDKKILVSHHGFGKYTMSGSEHAIFLSGLEYFPLDWVKPHFDYVALGHIHKRLTLSEDPPIIYPGSPIPMRFSESNQKYVSYVEVDSHQVKQEFIEIPIFRSLFQIETTPSNYKDQVKHKLAGRSKSELNSFVEIQMLLTEPLSGMADEIRKFISKKDANLLSYIPIVVSDTEKKDQRQDIANLSLNELFQNYYKLKYDNHEIPAELLESFNQIIEEINHENS